MKNRVNFLVGFLTFMLMVTIMSSLPICALAESKSVNDIMSDAIVICLGSSKAYVNNVVTLIDVQNPEVKPVVINNRTLLPVRFISENVGAYVRWYQETSSVTIDNHPISATITLNSTKMELSKRKADMTREEIEVTLDSPAKNINGRTFIPLRRLAEDILDKEVFFDRNLIVISDTASTLDKVRDKALIDEMIALFKDNSDYILGPVVTKRLTISAQDHYPQLQWTGTKFIATGDNNFAMESPDGVAWVKSAGKQVLSSDYQYLAKNIPEEYQKEYYSFNIASNGNGYVAVAHTILTSLDGISWTEQKSILKEDECLNSIVWGNDEYIAVGYAGLILTSPDAKTWTKQVSNSIEDLLDIEWNGKVFVAVGFDKSILTSTDGKSWTTKTFAQQPQTGELFRCVKWDGEKFIALGLKADNSITVFFQSYDGINWSKGTQIDYVVSDIKMNDDTYVFIGNITPFCEDPSALFSAPK